MDDNTYYGNGCPNGWDNGSDYSCSSKIAQTLDGETQDIGTYFNYAATSAGSLTDESTDVIIIPDSFCPLGWQLPYSGTGGDYYDTPKSWKNILGYYNIEYLVLGDGNKIRYYPLSEILSGTYFWGGFNKLVTFGGSGYVWTNTQDVNRTASKLAFNTEKLTYASDSYASGYQIRCIGIVFFLHRRHGGREPG